MKAVKRVSPGLHKSESKEKEVFLRSAIAGVEYSIEEELGIYSITVFCQHHEGVHASCNCGENLALLKDSDMFRSEFNAKDIQSLATHGPAHYSFSPRYAGQRYFVPRSILSLPMPC